MNYIALLFHIKQIQINKLTTKAGLYILFGKQIFYLFKLKLPAKNLF